VSTVPLKCRCGAVRGTLLDASPTTGSRLVCYCRDCQAFARFLGRPDVMDAAGGTDIFQVSPSQVRITDGLEHVACVRLFEKGLFRWYADCCKTPIGNMMGGGFPFIGVIVAFLEPAGDGRTADDVLGASRGGIFGSEAIGGCPPGAHAKASKRILLGIFKLVAGWAVRGKGHPQVFFGRDTKAPRVTPKVLTKGEREALR